MGIKNKESDSKKSKIGVSPKFIKFCLFFVILVAIALILKSGFVNADPAGATINSNSSASTPVYAPGSLTNPGGSINTVVFDVVQQNDKWKAYIGNITGSLTLDDGNGFTIFQWAMAAGDITGEVYAARSNSVDWSIINCSNVTTVENEDSAIGFTGASIDNINRTFNESIHNTIVSAGRTIPANSCRATATYVNDTKQDQSTADFQEILFASGTDLVYVAPINQGTGGYRDNVTVDFQLLVADDVSQVVTTYYFYVEIGG